MQLRRSEVLVITLIITVGVFLLSAYLLNLTSAAQIVEMKLNGRLIRSVIHGRHNVPDYGHQIEWQTVFQRSDPKRYGTSTEVFRDMVRSGLMAPHFALFGGGGVAAYAGSAPEEFRSTHNAWNLVTRQDRIKHERVPILFTRNLRLSALDGEFSESFVDDAPFGTTHGVVVTLGSSAHVLRRKRPEEWSPGTYSNRVLFPSGELDWD